MRCGALRCNILLCQGGGHEPAVEDVLGKVLILYWSVACPEQSMKGQKENVIKVQSVLKETASRNLITMNQAHLHYLCLGSLQKYCEIPCQSGMCAGILQRWHSSAMSAMPGSKHSLDVLLDNFWFFIFWICFCLSAQEKASLSDLKFSICTWNVHDLEGDSNWFVWFQNLVLVEAQDNLPMKVWATWQATVWILDTATIIFLGRFWNLRYRQVSNTSI